MAAVVQMVLVGMTISRAQKMDHPLVQSPFEGDKNITKKCLRRPVFFLISLIRTGSHAPSVHPSLAGYSPSLLERGGRWMWTKLGFCKKEVCVWEWGGSRCWQATVFSIHCDLESNHEIPFMTTVWLVGTTEILYTSGHKMVRRGWQGEKSHNAD